VHDAWTVLSIEEHCGYVGLAVWFDVRRLSVVSSP